MSGRCSAALQLQAVAGKDLASAVALLFWYPSTRAILQRPIDPSQLGSQIQFPEVIANTSLGQRFPGV